MKLSMINIIEILMLQRNRWMNPSIKNIHTEEELVEKISDDFLSENDITDKSEFFSENVCYESVVNLRRDMGLEAIRYHYPDYVSIEEAESDDKGVYVFDRILKTFEELNKNIELFNKENKNANSN